MDDEPRKHLHEVEEFDDDDDDDDDQDEYSDDDFSDEEEDDSELEEKRSDETKEETTTTTTATEDIKIESAASIGTSGSEYSDDGFCREDDDDNDDGTERTTTIDPEELRLGDLIAGGGFATVHYARWRKQRVAVKMLFDPKITKRMIDDFRREVRTMRRAGGHPNIVRVVGACTSPPRLCLVMERCHRTLFHLLHLSDVDPTDAQLASFAVDVASAVAHLHSLRPPICHRDIKSLNLLLDRALVPGAGVAPETRLKLCDFGLADAPSDGTATPQYSPPEQLRGGRLTSAGDVYSLGMVVWEMFTGKVPFDGFDPYDAKRAVIRGERPLIPRIGFPDALRSLLPTCWEQSAPLRPPACDVRAALVKFSEVCRREHEASSRLQNSSRFDALDDDLFSSLSSTAKSRK